MNHETRIKALEKEIAELKSFIKELKKENPRWLTLSQVTEQFGVSRTAVLNRISNGNLIHLKDWRKNGNRYMINSISVKKIM
jgi:hypothetical protein